MRQWASCGLAVSPRPAAAGSRIGGRTGPRQCYGLSWCARWSSGGCRWNQCARGWWAVKDLVRDTAKGRTVLGSGWGRCAW